MMQYLKQNLNVTKKAIFIYKIYLRKLEYYND